MIKIAHRALLNGPDKSIENHPDQIKKALSLGFNVEIDVWSVDNKFYLGHDEPTYKIETSFISNSRLWLHAKNLEALNAMSNMLPSYLINCFYHNVDDYVITSKGFIWTYPGKPLMNKSIAVLPEQFPDWDLSQAIGICTDFPNLY